MLFPKDLLPAIVPAGFHQRRRLRARQPTYGPSWEKPKGRRGTNNRQVLPRGAVPSTVALQTSGRRPYNCQGTSCFSHLLCSL